MDLDIDKRKRYLEIAPEDEARLARVHPALLRRSPEIIERFYRYLLGHEHTRKVLEAPGRVERLKKLQSEYFTRLTSGVYDRAYFEDRLKVGLAHERAGLDPQWYLGAYDRYLEIVGDVLREELKDDPEGCVAVMTSLTKIVFLDMGLAIDAYISKAHERLEESNRQLVKLDQVKRQLTEMIVHDLQNPLAGIEAFLHYLRGRRDLDGSEVDALEEALARCGDLENMIQNLLQIRKMEEGKLEVYLEEVDLRAFVPRCASAFELSARQNGKSISVSVPDEPVRARADQTLLQRILYNLIRNALRHTHEGTSVRIRVASSREITVADNGPGIPKEFHGALFEPFGADRLRAIGVRVDTGLGLPFCRMAATAMGAALDLSSESGKGASFTLRLP